jgi:MFS family permease
MILLMFALSRWSGGLVARYGARRPLMIGPLMVALAFALFALPSVGVAYSKSFLPAIVALGLGMAVTVAPLTTVVMNSVSQDRVGTASGINNAVARIAAVLAIAVLGMVMVTAFSSRLDDSLDHQSLAPDVIKQVRADAIKLAGLHVPGTLDSGTRTAIQRSVQEAFVFAFRIIMFICGGLAIVSAAIAWRMIGQSQRERDAIQELMSTTTRLARNGAQTGFGRT